MDIILAIVFVLAFVSWWSAVVSWILAVRARKPEIPLRNLLFGTKSFDPENFTPAGQRHQRRLIYSRVTFIACVGVIVIVVATSG